MEPRRSSSSSSGHRQRLRRLFLAVVAAVSVVLLLLVSLYSIDPASSALGASIPSPPTLLPPPPQQRNPSWEEPPRRAVSDDGLTVVVPLRMVSTPPTLSAASNTAARRGDALQLHRTTTTNDAQRNAVDAPQGVARTAAAKVNDGGSGDIAADGGLVLLSGDGPIGSAMRAVASLRRTGMPAASWRVVLLFADPRNYRAMLQHRCHVKEGLSRRTKTRDGDCRTNEDRRRRRNDGRMLLVNATASSNEEVRSSWWLLKNVELALLGGRPLRIMRSFSYPPSHLQAGEEEEYGGGDACWETMDIGDGDTTNVNLVALTSGKFLIASARVYLDSTMLRLANRSSNDNKQLFRRPVVVLQPSDTWRCTGRSDTGATLAALASSRDGGQRRGVEEGSHCRAFVKFVSLQRDEHKSGGRWVNRSIHQVEEHARDLARWWWGRVEERRGGDGRGAASKEGGTSSGTQKASATNAKAVRPEAGSVLPWADQDVLAPHNTIVSPFLFLGNALGVLRFLQDVHRFVEFHRLPDGYPMELPVSAVYNSHGQPRSWRIDAAAACSSDDNNSDATTFTAIPQHSETVNSNSNSNHRPEDAHGHKVADEYSLLSSADFPTLTPTVCRHVQRCGGACCKDHHTTAAGDAPEGDLTTPLMLLHTKHCMWAKPLVPPPQPRPACQSIFHYDAYLLHRRPRALSTAEGVAAAVPRELVQPVSLGNAWHASVWWGDLKRSNKNSTADGGGGATFTPATMLEEPHLAHCVGGGRSAVLGICGGYEPNVVHVFVATFAKFHRRSCSQLYLFVEASLVDAYKGMYGGEPDVFVVSIGPFRQRLTLWDCGLVMWRKELFLLWLEDEERKAAEALGVAVDDGKGGVGVFKYVLACDTRDVHFQDDPFEPLRAVVPRIRRALYSLDDAEGERKGAVDAAMNVESEAGGTQDEHKQTHDATTPNNNHHHNYHHLHNDGEEEEGLLLILPERYQIGAVDFFDPGVYAVQRDRIQDSCGRQAFEWGLELTLTPLPLPPLAKPMVSDDVDPRLQQRRRRETGATAAATPPVSMDPFPLINDGLYLGTTAAMKDVFQLFVSSMTAFDGGSGATATTSNNANNNSHGVSDHHATSARGRRTEKKDPNKRKRTQCGFANDQGLFHCFAIGGFAHSAFPHTVVALNPYTQPYTHLFRHEEEVRFSTFEDLHAPDGNDLIATPTVGGSDDDAVRLRRRQTVERRRTKQAAEAEAARSFAFIHACPSTSSDSNSITTDANAGGVRYAMVHQAYHHGPLWFYVTETFSKL